LAITPADLTITVSPYLKQLTYWDSQDFDRRTPAPAHFWQWHEPANKAG
jgi:hypothetical protein